MSRRIAWIIASAATVALPIVLVVSNAELVVVHAVADVPLYDPNTIVGSFGVEPKVLGTLVAGHSLVVSGCNARKSDIDIQGDYGGQPVVVGGGIKDFKLTRTPARIWDDNAITSCLGFFEGVSKGT